MGTIAIIKRGINIVMIYMSSSQVLHEMLELWPSCKMVNGKARHSQSQGSVERCNRDVEAMLACWRHDNKRNDWSLGLKEIQYAKNSRFHTGISRSPFKALFGSDPSNGLEKVQLDEKVLHGVETEEDLEAMCKGKNTRYIITIIGLAFLFTTTALKFSCSTQSSPNSGGAL